VNQVQETRRNQLSDSQVQEWACCVTQMKIWRTVKSYDIDNEDKSVSIGINKVSPPEAVEIKIKTLVI
jgi:hypothetical protein